MRVIAVAVVTGLLAGAATTEAARQITGAAIKDGSVRSADVAGLTLKDFKRGSLPVGTASEGSPGPAGAPGAQSTVPGPAGPPGRDGVGIQGERGVQGVPGPLGRVVVFQGTGNGGAVQPGSQNSVAGFCPQGSSVIGGGYRTEARIVETIAHRTAGDEVYVATARNDTQEVLHLAAWALCLRVEQ